MGNDARTFSVRNLAAASIAAALLVWGISAFASASAWADASEEAADAPAEAPAAQEEPAQETPDAPSSDAASASSSSAASSSSQAASTAGKQEAPVDEAKAKAEKEAKEKLAKAESISATGRAMASDLARFQGELDAAQRAFEEIAAQRDSKRAEFDEANGKLDGMRDNLSDLLVASYKSGGVTSYLDAMLYSTSYREFLTSWYMLNAATDVGGEAFLEQKRVVDKLEAEVTTLEAQADDAKKALVKAQASVNRIILSQLALDQQAATLRVEAASLTGDAAALAAAKADLDRATRALAEARSQGVGRDVVLEGEGTFTNPCPGAVYSSGFGYRSFDNSFHKGLDLAIAEGSPYYAAESGTVIAATNDGGDNGGAGNWIVIDHGGGCVTKYMHSLATLVGVGDHVERGQLIGLVGNTGNSFGAHLHFQVEVGNTPVNPIVYL